MKLKSYIKECEKTRKDYPYNFDVLSLIRFFPKWYFSLSSGISSLDSGKPWLTYSAIQFLESFITKDMRVYEFGSGGSTVFFCKSAKEVVSTEHDPEWHHNVENYLTKHNYSNCKVNLLEPKPNRDGHQKSIENPDSYISSNSQYFDQSFEDYAASIDQYPDNYFDIVLIDGRARPSCLKHSISKVKSNGFVILDNAERLHYSYIHESLDNPGWKKSRFYGPGAFSYVFWETCFWQKVCGG